MTAALLVEAADGTSSAGPLAYFRRLAEQAICSCPAGTIACVRRPPCPGDACIVCAAGCWTVLDVRTGTETTWQHEDPDVWVRAGGRS